ncbi:cell division protein PerM [Nocardioides sp.]|uniref:cell division protein PerM n=1 Tax=Nocardioides sp. TaxID=35761 RepID=UPI003D0F70B1
MFSATLGGLVAALAPLTVMLAIGVIGWFVSDAGAHGTPSDGLRIGALGWLMAHGSGVEVGGVSVSAVPLGVTLMCAWVIGRLGLRAGESVSGHGPDAHAIADGDRDWTVPVTASLFAAAYVVVAVVTTVLAATPETAPSTGRVVLWALALSLFVATPAIAVGSGRAAIWSAAVPVSVRAAVTTATRTLLGFLGVSALVLAVTLALDFGAAANVLSRLHADGGDSALFTLVTLAVLPNAVIFSGSYLLGPGFALGTGTLVSPTVVALGPVPAFPLLAALPDNGPAAAWVVALMGLPFVVAAFAAARTHRRFPTLRWEEGAVRGVAGGVLAGIAFTVLAQLAGGSVGPGRMQDVSPNVADVLIHAITAFGLGGLVGGLFMTWRERRSSAAADGLDSGA